MRKRLRSLGMSSFSEYCRYLFSSSGRDAERIHIIDVVTTNKTDFFREPGHFDYLARIAVPELLERYGAGRKQVFTAWSAGCSTGEEPYTLAIVLSEIALQYTRFSYVVLATDISTKVLETARNAVYPEDRVVPVPPALRKKYFLRSKDRTNPRVKVAPEIRSTVKFRRLNFMDDDFGMREPLDVIFCRNVIIYFDRPTQEKLIRRFCRHLRPGGYIFMGHSETLHGMDLPLAQVAPTVYRRIS